LRRIAERALVFHTSRVSCEFLDPVGVGLDDAVLVEMVLTRLRGGRLTVEFGYFRDGARRTLLARGEQAICCKRPTPTGLVPDVFPCELLEALRRFADSEELRQNIDDALAFGSPAQRSASSVAAEGLPPGVSYPIPTALQQPQEGWL
jgi:hypothetical protein